MSVDELSALFGHLVVSHSRNTALTVVYDTLKKPINMLVELFISGATCHNTVSHLASFQLLVHCMA